MDVRLEYLQLATSKDIHPLFCKKIETNHYMYSSDTMEHLNAYDSDSDTDGQSTIISEQGHEQDETLSYEGDDLPLTEGNQLFFREDGREMSREEFIEEEDTDWMFRTTRMPEFFVLRHPRVLLNFLRFIDSLNEINQGNETFRMEPLSQATVSQMMAHGSILNPPEEFREDVEELVSRIFSHANLSG